MRITFLGTGSADGWPNPFCECDSCSLERVEGRARRPASALVDDVIIIDCGPAATHAAGAAGLSLRAVEHVLITHGHPDHLDPAFLLSRHWAQPEHGLVVWAPPRALDLCRDWLAPSDPVELRQLLPGDRVALPTVRGTYDLHVLPAAHAHGNGDVLAEEAILVDLTAPDGRRLLYATDTGPLPTPTIDAIAGAVDVLVLDETFGDHRSHDTGHLHLDTFADTVSRLRSASIVTTSTRVLATHLSHHNPPVAELRARLRNLGATAPEDLDIIDTDAQPPPRSLFILGGARSGKSVYAERVADLWGDDVTYVATGGVRDDDEDWAARVSAHVARRPATWRTVETLDVAAELRAGRKGSVILVDCLTLWLTGVLDSRDAWRRLEAGESPAIESEVLTAVDVLVDSVRSAAADLILVSNEVGLGVVPSTASGRLFRDLMGRVNAAVAAACDSSTFVIAGRGVPLTDLVAR